METEGRNCFLPRKRESHHREHCPITIMCECWLAGWLQHNDINEDDDDDEKDEWS